jgi:CheY-like chemotaxis protein
VLLLPLALALLDVLLVERGGSVYGVPLGSVEEGVAVGETFSLEGRQAIELRGSSVPLFDLAGLLGQAAPPLPPSAPALIVAAGGRRVAVACDVLLGEEEVVVKPLGALLGHVSGYLGAAILGDGRIALLLDSSELSRGGLRTATAALTPVAAVPAARKVLVVEDSFTVRELQRSILEAAGYSVETARHGREALDRLVGSNDVSLVLTDVEMPEMDGLELTRAIRDQPALSRLPVVIVTTRGEDDDRRLGMEAGADAYMAKRSFDQQALLETVERLVGR